jgi:hypothetical protein
MSGFPLIRREKRATKAESNSLTAFNFNYGARNLRYDRPNPQRSLRAMGQVGAVAVKCAFEGRDVTA